LITQKCIDIMGIDPAALGMREIAETYEHIGQVPAWVHDLDRRWQEEDRRQRVYVSAKDAVYQISVPTSAPPQVVWEFLTSPGRRSLWQYGSTGVEEILDWRPYDYYSDRSTMPGGSPKFLSTVELEPTAKGGTTVHFRFAAPRTARERAQMEQMLPSLDVAMTNSNRALIEQMEVEVVRRSSGAGEEPEVPRPKPDGLFAEMQPLLIVG
jgi:uncharacterized protein YndB with AHSA1/START domain